MTKENVKILLVDDDSIDRRTVKHAFKKLNIPNEIIEANHGASAFEILEGKHAKLSLDQPFLVLLDINMPVLDGFGFLNKIRNHKQLKKAIVFILTTSNNERDRLKAYDYQVAGYLVKSSLEKDFLDKFRMLHKFIQSVEFLEQGSYA